MDWAEKFRRRIGLDRLPTALRRIIVGVIGGTILLIGIVLVVLPGPAFLVVPLGLVILATEFAWARWLLRRARTLWRGQSRDLERRPLCRPTDVPQPDATDRVPPSATMERR
jgi:hypothetical protein